MNYTRIALAAIATVAIIAGLILLIAGGADGTRIQ